MNDTTQLIEAIASLVSAAARPLVFLFLLVRFRTALGEFVANMSEFSFRAPGLEATARRREIEAAVALGAASAKQASENQTESDVRGVAGAVVDALPSGRSKRRFEGASLLWLMTGLTITSMNVRRWRRLAFAST